MYEDGGNGGPFDGDVNVVCEVAIEGGFDVSSELGFFCSVLVTLEDFFAAFLMVDMDV